MHRRHPLVIAAALAFVTAASAQGQAGTADLRYVQPLPSSVTFTSVDSISNTMGMPTGAGASVGDMIGSARAMSGLLPLPGRELRIGESWADTVHATPTVEGTEFEVDVTFAGTYVSDTMVDGRHLNILRFETTLVSELNGTMQGMEVSQKMTSTTSEIVLWDSALHSVVHRDGTTETATEMYLPAQDMSMNSRGRSRSITTTQPQT